MNAYAIFAADQALRLANERHAGLRAEAATHRLAATIRPARSRLSAIASAISSFRSGVTVIDSDWKPALPTLSDYPYRS